MLTEKAILKTETVFSEDRRHRYLLRKEWDTKKPRATIVMTNPSSADLMTMDYTTLYIINNVVRLDFGSVDIVNMVSKITTRLDVKNDIDSKADRENIDFIVKSADKADKVIIAWGKLGENNKKVRELQESLLETLRPFREKLYIIASNNGEDGFHPLAPQIRFSWVLKKFDIEAALPPKTETSSTPQ
mgnify:FL=1